MFFENNKPNIHLIHNSSSLLLSHPHAHGSELPWVGRILQGKIMGFVAKSKQASTPKRHMKVLGTLTLEPGIVRRRFEAQNEDTKLKQWAVNCSDWRHFDGSKIIFIRLQSSQPIDVSIPQLL